jgi:NitT/TauT family transport system permease protein
LRIVLPILFWLLAYELAALIIDHEYFLPHLTSVFSSLFTIISSPIFFKVCGLTLLRVLIALALGMLLGIIFGVLSAKFKAVYYLLNPFMTIVKATPVASFIIVLWILLSGDALAVIIALSMVMPIIWQSTYNAFDTIDKRLLEVTEIFQLSERYKFSVLYLPSLKKYLVPSVITSVGLAWKSEIATEIIAYTRNSIGQLINDGKYNLDTPTVFAWTFIVILFSVLFEAFTKLLLRRASYES